MKKPLIAITPSYSEDGKIRLSPEYLEALLLCDAVPVTLPYTEDPTRLRAYADGFDGFLFSGGVDVAPSYYGEETRFDSVKIDPMRDRFEFALFDAVYGTGKPIFGICRGIQFLNVACGGSLYQHVEGHSQSAPASSPTHGARVEAGSRIASMLGETALAVNSFHHQAVKVAAPSLSAVAWAEDGTIEALEAPSHPFLVGVQWHPERMLDTSSHPLRLFRAFVDATR